MSYKEKHSPSFTWKNIPKFISLCHHTLQNESESMVPTKSSTGKWYQPAQWAGDHSSELGTLHVEQINLQDKENRKNTDMFLTRTISCVSLYLI